MSLNTLTHTSLARDLAAATLKAQAEKCVVRISDGEGLMLVVRANVAPSWLLRYTLKGKRCDMTIGRYPNVTLAAAREAAVAARSRVAAGIDPTTHRKDAREQEVAAANTADTVRFVFEKWFATLSREVKGVPLLAEISRRNIEAAFEKNVLPEIGSKPAHEVTRDDIQKLLRVIEDRGAFDMVRRVRMWLKQMFEWASGHEAFTLLKTSPVPMGTLKTMGFTTGSSKRESHYPAVTNVQEVGPLMRKLLAVDHFSIRTALLMSAHTFQRPTEIREVTWSEVDLDAARWTIPASRMGKTQREHWVPLSQQMVEILRKHAGCYGNEGYLFPGRNYKSGDQAISEGTLTSRLNAMGYVGKHSPHGFRAMARTILDEHLKVDERFIEKQLAHTVDGSGLNNAYNRAEYWDERVKMMQVWSDWLDSAASSAPKLALAA